MKKKRTAKRGIDLSAAADESMPLAEDRLWSYYKPLKKPVTLRLDADVLAWFKKQGPGYQARINRALRQVMVEQRKRR